MPNQMMTSGINARCGTFLTICTVVSRKRSAVLNKPFRSPSRKPMLPPIKSPQLARSALARMFFASSPDTVRLTAELTISKGAGKIREEIQLFWAAMHQAAIRKTGRNQPEIRPISFDRSGNS
jgi:hypothetical protein